VSTKAIAVVVAPNLYAPAKEATGQEIIQETNGAVSIVERAVAERLRLRVEVRKKRGGSEAAPAAAAAASDR